MSQYAHKGQILPLVNQMVPIAKDTTFHASYDYGLHGFNQGKVVHPIGAQQSIGIDGASWLRIPGVSLIEGTEATMELWVKSDWNNATGDSEYGYQTLFVQQQNWTNMFGLVHSPVGVLSVENRNGGTSDSRTFSYNMSSHVNKWTHIALTFKEGYYDLYVNGERVAGGAGIYGTLSANLGELSLGDNAYSSRLMCRSDLSNARIWKKALSASEIQVSMTQQAPDKEQGLLGNWKLNEKEGLISYDSSNGGNDGVWNGSISRVSGPTIATITEGKFRNGVLIEPGTTNMYPGPIQKGRYFASAYNGEYGFGAATNSQWVIENSDQPVPGVDVQKVSRIESGVDQRLYINWSEMVEGGGELFTPGEERVLSFYYYGTYGKELRLYMSASGTIQLSADNAVSGNNTSSIVVPVIEGEWNRVVVTLKNIDTTDSTFAWGWMVLHKDREVSTLDNTHYWKISAVQIEERATATSYTQELRPLGMLSYPKELLNPSNFSVSFWFNLPQVHKTSTGNAGHEGSWYHELFSIAPPRDVGDADILSFVCTPADNYTPIRKLEIRSHDSTTNSVTTINDGEWYHTTLAYDGTSYKVYVNGVLEMTVPSSTPITPYEDSVLMVGGGYRGAPHAIIDEVRIEARAISAEEAAAWASAGLYYNYLDYSIEAE